MLVLIAETELDIGLAFHSLVGSLRALILTSEIELDIELDF
jgi:hypothetical protein